MREVYIIGSYSTKFGKWIESSHKDLTRLAVRGVLDDVKIDAKEIESVWFSCSGWGLNAAPTENDPGIKGQMNVRGQVALAPLVNEGWFPALVPCINVEGACASGSLALHGAWKDVLSGLTNVARAVGVEKTYYPKHPLLVLQAFTGGIDTSEMDALIEEYRTLGAQVGKEWKGGGHTIFMDTYATQAAYHMWKWGTTREQYALAASKNHFHGSLNPLAQYQFEMPIEKILADYEVSWPLTRSMCCPLGDGGAAAIVCSKEYLATLPAEIQRRAVKILASVVSSGRKKDIAEPAHTYFAARKAYGMAGIGPENIDVAEIHDATSFCEIYQAEMLGFCPVGEGGKFIESGATRFDGSKPMNTSGGLESKGHPIGATGLSQINEIVMQLRGEAGARQVKNAEIGLVENGGGVVSFEEYCAAITILQKPDA